MNNERLDDAKYAYTKGWATIQVIADRISVIAHGVNPLDPSDRDWIHDQLREVYDELCRLYVLLVDEAVDAMNRVPKAGDFILDDNRYMDGSQVWRAVVSHSDASGRPTFANVYLDDGSRDWYDYDEAGSFGWNTVVSHFDAADVKAS